MRLLIVSSCIATAWSISSAATPERVGRGGYKPAAVFREHVVSPRMHEVLSMAELPEWLDWRNISGTDYTSILRNQHIPKYCGACWAFAAATAFSDRIRIARGAASREVNLAVQVILNCDIGNNGCSGGDPLPVYHFVHQAGGLPEETCQPYVADGHDTGKVCSPLNVCRSCDAERGCHAMDEYEVFEIEEYGKVVGEEQMIAELQRGPLACNIATPPLFDTYVGESIYKDTTNDTDVDHIIVIDGYGVENGTKYWYLRNSWGTYWGHYGWMKIIRGINNVMVESNCAWATPANGGFPRVRSAYTYPNASWNAQHAGYSHNHTAPPPVPAPVENVAEEDEESRPDVMPEIPAACRTAWNDWDAVGGERVLSPLPHEVLNGTEVPQSWDWRNVSGANYVTWNTNERAPEYCGSCWAQGVASALSDRISVQKNNVWPMIALSPQALVNCVGGSSCEAGDPAAAYAYIHQHGLTDHTCQTYRGRDLPCDDIGICTTCAPNNEESEVDWPGNCVKVPNPMLYFVTEYGSVRGASNMKAEIYQRGPIGCGLEATAGFQQYKSGVYSEFRYLDLINHQVSVSGWGVTGDDAEHWVGRNSWGVYWGEEGWFRILMHGSNLGIELDCDWGVPVEGPKTPFTVMSGEDEL